MNKIICINNANHEIQFEKHGAESLNQDFRCYGLVKHI